MNDRAGRAQRRFVTFEGVDGAGKSTHLDWFVGALRARSGAEVVETREPGGTPLGEALRNLVLHTSMAPETEAMLMFAARRQHVVDVIAPALERGAWVVCDRFTDASIAYQGAGRGVSRERLEALRRWVHPDLEPGVTVLFDVAPDVARARLAGARDPDRFEREEGDFFGRVREAYLQIATAEPARVRLIDGSKPVNGVRQQLEEIVATLCSRRQ